VGDEILKSIMDEQERKEKKNHLVGILTSLGIHAAILVLFLFVMGWSAPNPPLGELGSGVELNFGLDEEGSGDVQTLTPQGSEEKPAETKLEEQPKQELPQEEKQVSTPDPATSEKALTGEDEESPITAKETKKEPAKNDVREKAPEVKPKKKVVNDTKSEERKEVKASTPKKEEGEKTSNSGASQGDDKNKTGNKGSPEGSLDPNGQYTGKKGTGGGSEGGGGGGGISVTGFTDFEKPDIKLPDVPEESYGTYRFLIRVNGEGDIVKITLETKGISTDAEKILRQHIEKVEFIPAKNKMPQFSEGTITFKIVASKKK
jgi:periplasmic protein TonB